jgi:hypothetical protein
MPAEGITNDIPSKKISLSMKGAIEPLRLERMFIKPWVIFTAVVVSSLGSSK